LTASESVKRLMARYGPDASIMDIMREQIGSCPHRNPTLAQLFSPYPEAG